MAKANNSRFLGALGFLGFLSFLGFLPTRYSYLAKLAWLSYLSLGSLLVLVPFDRSKVKAPIDPKKKAYLGFLVCLAFLAFLGTPPPMLMFAGPAGLAILAGLAVQSRVESNRSISEKK